MKKNSGGGKKKNTGASKQKGKKLGTLDQLCRKFTGLTMSELNRKRQLERRLAGKDSKEKKEISTQQTIAFENMYEDGICKVSKEYYTKMIEFSDQNYMLLDDEDRKAILSLYSQCINYFDPSVKFQIFLFNRKVSDETLEAQYEIAPQNDSFDDIREEFSDMLKTLSAKGTNGVIKSKYLAFGVKATGEKEARQRLEALEEGILKCFRTMGSSARILNGAERMDLLYEYFNQEKMKKLHFSYEEMERSGDSEKDYIAPKKMDFRTPKKFRADGMHGSVKYLDIIAPKINDELLMKILDIDSNLAVSMHMQTIEPLKAIKMLKEALSNVQKNKIDEQKKAVRGGWDMDIMPPDMLLYEKAALELLDDLNTSNQKLIQTTILIAGFGSSAKELEAVEQRILGIIQQANCRFLDLAYEQEAAMIAASPIGYCNLFNKRNLVTKNLAILVPFNTRELFQMGQSLYYGRNALSNNMIMADRKQLRTPNGVILGTPGSGKSFSAKREILGSFLVTKDDILICDPEGEYFPLVKALGGEVVKLSTSSTQYLNPMDIQLSHKGDKEALKLKSDFIITLCDAIAGGEKGLANDEKGIIDRCIDKIYETYFLDPSPEKMPMLEDLYKALLTYEPDSVVAEEFAADAKAKAVRIANSLILYVHGSQNYFNHRTNVDSHNRIVCFDIRDLGNQLKELGMLIVQDAVWNRVSKNRERHISTRYYCDEFHLLLRDKQTAKYSVEIWKRFRKWGGIPTGLTQNVGDFLQSSEIEGILGNSDFIYLLNQSAQDQVVLAEKLNLSGPQLEYVTNSDSGCGLIIFNDAVIPFIDRYPTDTKTFRIMNTKPEEDKEDGLGEERTKEAG